jgi:hypothetical protein
MAYSEVYSNLNDYIYIFALFMLLLGVFGNYYMFKVFISCQSLRKNTLSLYFRSLSVINQLLMLYLIRVAALGKYNWDITLTSDFMCKTVRYTTFILRLAAAWLLVVASLDRFISIRFPRQFKFFFTADFQLATIGCIAGLSILIYSPMVWNSQLVSVLSPVSNVTNVVCKLQSSLVYFWLDLTLSAIVPFILMVFVNMVLINYISKSRARIGVAIISQQQHHSGSSGKDRKFAITVLSLNVLFITLHVPAHIADLLNTYTSLDPQLSAFIIFLARTLYYSSSSIDFYVQIAVNSVVRDKFFQLFNFKVIRTNAIDLTTRAPTSATHQTTRN